MSEEDDAKAKVEEGQDDKATPPEEEPKVEPPKVEEPTVTPEPEQKGEGEKPPKLEQRLKTVEGMLKKSQERVSQLEEESRSFGELKGVVEGFRGDLNLVTDVLSEMTTDNEALQERVTKTRQDREATEKKIALTQQIHHEMGQRIGAAERVLVATHKLEQPTQIGALLQLSMADESLRPAFVAADKGDMGEALRLTNLAVDAKVATVRFTTTAKVEEPPATVEEKKKLAVNTGSPAPALDWREKSAADRIKGGMEKARVEHGW